MLRARALVLVTLLSGACDVSTPFAPSLGVRRAVDVSVALDRRRMVPGDTTYATVTVLVLPEDRTLSEIRFRASGLGGSQELALPVVGAGHHQYRVLMTVQRLPIEGEIALEATARIDEASDLDRDTLRIADDGPPLVLLQAAGTAIHAPGRLRVPDSLIVDYVAVDTAGLDSVMVRVSGAITYAHTRQLDLEEGIGERIPLWVPAAPLGDSLVVEASAVDFFGRVSTQRAVVRIADMTWPTIVPRIDTVPHPELGPGTFPLTFVTGDTVRVAMEATDDYALRMIGVQWWPQFAPFGDSIAVTGTRDSMRFAMVVPPGLSSNDALFEFFATDSSGNRSIFRIRSAVVDRSAVVRAAAPSTPPRHSGAKLHDR